MALPLQLPLIGRDTSSDVCSPSDTTASREASNEERMALQALGYESATPPTFSQ